MEAIAGSSTVSFITWICDHDSPRSESFISRPADFRERKRERERERLLMIPDPITRSGYSPSERGIGI